MRLQTVRIRGFRSILDSGEFAVADRLTWIVGPNEAGKSAALEALQLLRAPSGTAMFDAADDYPRAWAAQADADGPQPAAIPVVTAIFALDEAEMAALPPRLRGGRYEVTRYLDNHFAHRLLDAGPLVAWEALEATLRALAAEAGEGGSALGRQLDALIADPSLSERRFALAAERWVEEVVRGAGNPALVAAGDSAVSQLRRYAEERLALGCLVEAVPVFVLFDSSIRLASWVDLKPVPDRLPPDAVEDWKESYGNECLMKLLSLSSGAHEAPHPLPDTDEDEGPHHDMVEPFDPQRFRMGTVEARLTAALRDLWCSPKDRPASERVHIDRSAGYLRVAVADAMGSLVPLDQRSEGLQWLLSFLVVLFAERALPGRQTILLLDDPGLALDAARRARFLDHVRELSAEHQVLIAVHSEPPINRAAGSHICDARMEPFEEGTRIRTRR
jgi:hypothetical protein